MVGIMGISIVHLALFLYFGFVLLVGGWVDGTRYDL